MYQPAAWVSYSGGEAMLLAMVLLVVAGGFAYAGKRLRAPLKITPPGSPAAVWAAFGFAFPAEPLPLAVNIISKILCFVAAIMLFVWRKDTEVSGVERDDLSLNRYPLAMQAPMRRPDLATPFTTPIGSPV